MELRYMGFEQVRNTRTYRFMGIVKGEPAARYTVNADMALFLKHHVGIQEGPTLCAQKLAADLVTEQVPHELTNDDMVAYVTTRAAKEARKAESRRGGRAPSRPVTQAGNQ